MNILRRIEFYLLSIMTAGTLCACANGSAPEGGNIAGDTETKTEFFAMDTYIQFTAYGDRAEEALDEAEEKLENINKLL